MIISFSFCWCNFEFNGILALDFFAVFLSLCCYTTCNYVWPNSVYQFECCWVCMHSSFVINFLLNYAVSFKILLLIFDSHGMDWNNIIKRICGTWRLCVCVEILYKKLCKIALPSIFICFTFFAYMTLLLMMLIFQFILSNNFSIETVQRFRLLVENKSLISIRTLKLNELNRNVT